MITRVYLKNWKSHHETELDFSGGVNVLVGEMGSGKSSVLEAMCFALYGKTPAIQSRRVNIDEVIRRLPSPASEAVVEVGFRHDGKDYTVRREVERGKGTTTSELRKDGELLTAPQASEVTEDVEDLLGIDFDLFSRAIYSEQNELDYFLTLRAGERKEKIDQLLNLDRFETARSTLVSVVNRLEGRRNDREEELAELEEELEEGEIDDLEEKVADLEDEIETLKEEQDDVDEQLSDAREVLEQLKEQKEDYEEMKSRRTALETKIESLQERIDAVADEAGPYSDTEEDRLEERKAELEEALETLEQQEEEIVSLEKDLEVLDGKEEELEDEREELEEKMEDVEALDDLEDDIEELEAELEEIRSRKERAQGRIEELQETLSQLSGAADECPTCGQEMTEEHRVEVLKESRAEKEELEQAVDDLDEREEELAATVDEKKEERDQLVELRGSSDRLETVEEALDDIRQEKEEAREELASLQEAYSEEDVEERKDALEQISAGIETATLREEREKRVDELDELVAEMEDAGFDEDALEESRERVSDLEKDRSVLKSDINGKQEVLEERRKRLEEMEEKVGKVETYSEMVETYREKEEVMDELKHALEATQTELRERFVSSVNDVMEEVWERIYPYQDYQGIRLNAQEDYALELRDGEGNWISVEGEVSGGERHSSALTLRIALSIVLAPSWRVLMLDEPTHNLDATAIEDLSDTLRERVSEIVDQLFLITHEERLETAATADLYRLSKLETGSGLTDIETASVE